MADLQKCTGLSFNLYEYQLAVTDWMIKHPKQKGLFVRFKMGTGKTLTAINVAEMLRSKGEINMIVIVGPKSVLKQFAQACRDCLRLTKKQRLPACYKLYTYEGFRRAGLTSRGKKVMLIVDEVHNLRTQSGKQTQAMLEFAEKHAKKVLLLSGTPFVNTLADIAPAARMMTPVSEWTKFPVSEEAFDGRYQNAPKTFVAAFKDKVAYYEPSMEERMPKVVVHHKKVPLTKAQADAIQDVRDHGRYRLNDMQKLALQRALTKEGNLAVAAKLSDRINVFLNKSRRLANASDVRKCEDKVGKLITTAVKGAKPVLIYSEYIDAGVDNIGMCMKKRGVKEADIKVFTGKLRETQRIALMRDYNAGKIPYLLMTRAAAEGIDLKNTRQIHILEPHWNEGRIRQIIGRGVRIDSHKGLPANQRKVDVYRWMSTHPDKTLSPGEHIYGKALAKQEVLDRFDALLKEASIPVTIKEMVMAEAVKKPKAPRKPRRKPKKKPGPKRKPRAKPKPKPKKKPRKPRKPSRCAGHQPPCPKGCRTAASYCRAKPGKKTCRGVPTPCKPARCGPVRAHCRKSSKSRK